MTVDYISLYGIIDTENGELFLDSDEDNTINGPNVESLKNCLNLIINILSEEGIVDLDLEYGHINRAKKTQVHEVVFFVDDQYRGYVTILVKYD